MSPLLRWIRFNLVGMVGMAVQLATLALIQRATGRLLLATATAVEAAILHNFCAHLRFTWPDRPATALLTRLLRFQFSNGAVSLAGNLLLMPLLVHRAHLPLIPANLTAITACSTVNFFTGDRWIFTPSSQAPSSSL